MDEEKNLKINGFQFENKDDAILAAQEQSKIKKIEEKLDTKNPKMVLMIYQKAIDNQVFKTMVGYEFLKKIQNYLKGHGIQDVKAIPVVNPKIMQEVPKKKCDKNDNSEEKIRILQNQIKTYRYVIVILIVMSVAMVIISFTGNKPTILNYERKIQNKYSTWEEELKEREDTIRQKEKELNILIE